MLLHIGGDEIVFKKDVIAIIDLEITQSSKDTNIFLQKSQKEKNTKNIHIKNPKSYIITNINDINIIYYSNISIGTLSKRMNSKNYIAEKK